MLDIKWIRENPEALDRALMRRNHPAQAESLLLLDQQRRTHVKGVQEAQEQRNIISKEISHNIAQGNQSEAEILKQKVSALKDFLSIETKEEQRLTQALEEQLSLLPNIPLDDVPDGCDSSENLELRRVGVPRSFSFSPKEHFVLGEALGMMDFEQAGHMSGARFVILSRQLAQLERALGQFMLDMHIREHGYCEVSAPLLVRSHALYGTAQLPKFSEDLFQTTDERWLIPTAEVPLSNLLAKTTIDISRLPLRFTALTPCFRSEAGSAGRDTRGMLRQHQFWKVELVSLTDAQSSLDELERMTQCAEAVLKRLELPFRTVMLCSGDMGFSACKTYDIEVWMPGQDQYREISSCSLCGDFQARRMNIRYLSQGEKALHFVHTLNGSAMAVGRCLIAVMENYQREDGKIIVPEALLPYMNGIKLIGS